MGGMKEFILKIYYMILKISKILIFKLQSVKNKIIILMLQCVMNKIIILQEVIN